MSCETAGSYEVISNKSTFTSFGFETIKYNEIGFISSGEKSRPMPGAYAHVCLRLYYPYRTNLSLTASPAFSLIFLMTLRNELRCLIDLLEKQYALLDDDTAKFQSSPDLYNQK